MSCGTAHRTSSSARPSSTGAAATERLIDASLERYRSTERESYGAFRPGDHVAPLGAVGVLATLVGVPPATTAARDEMRATGGLGKAWLALLVIPLVWIGKRLKG